MIKERFLAAGKALFEVVEARQIRTPEPIDRLVIIPDDANVVASELLDEIELRVVCVLKLIDKDVRVAIAVLLQ